MDLTPYPGIAGLMLAAGLLGGLANHLARPPAAAGKHPAAGDTEPAPGLWADILVSVLAAFVTPLFLSLAKSTLFDDVVLSLAGKKEIRGDAFVFFGFCLIAAFSARIFVNNVSQTVLGLLAGQRNLDTRVKDVEADVAEVSAEVETDSPDEEEAPPLSTKGLSFSRTRALSTNEHHMLQALVSRPFTWRSVAGVRKQVGLSRETATEVLEELVKDHYADRKRSRSDSILYRITAGGRAALGLDPLVSSSIVGAGSD